MEYKEKLERAMIWLEGQAYTPENHASVILSRLNAPEQQSDTSPVNTALPAGSVKDAIIQFEYAVYALGRHHEVRCDTQEKLEKWSKELWRLAKEKDRIRTQLETAVAALTAPAQPDTLIREAIEGRRVTYKNKLWTEKPEKETAACLRFALEVLDGLESDIAAAPGKRL